VKINSYNILGICAVFAAFYLLLTGHGVIFIVLCALGILLHLLWAKWNKVAVVNYFIWAFIIVSLIKVQFISVLVVSSESMVPTLFIGDRIVIRKVGFDSGRGDIVVFDSPENKGELMVKRIAAKGGDTVLIDSSKLFINGMLQSADYVVSSFRVNKSPRELESVIEAINFSYSFVESIPGRSFSRLYIKDAEKEKLDDIDIRYRKVLWSGKPNGDCYPHKSVIVNGRDFWGGVVVPFGGYSIMLNDSTFEWYGETINKYEGVELTYSNGNYFIEGVLQKEFVFTNDYLFLLGDNRHRSRDSRYWGFIPESSVIGKYFLCFPR
jgi:signal peptidase I